MRHVIVMVTSSYPRFPGDSVGTFMDPIAKSLAARGHDVHVVAPWHPLVERGAAVTPGDDGADALVVTGFPADAIGDLAASGGFALHQLHTEIQSLEDVFLDLTHDEEGIR